MRCKVKMWEPLENRNGLLLQKMIKFIWLQHKIHFTPTSYYQIGLLTGGVGDQKISKFMENDFSFNMAR